MYCGKQTAARAASNANLWLVPLPPLAACMCPAKKKENILYNTASALSRNVILNEVSFVAVTHFYNQLLRYVVVEKVTERLKALI